MLKIAHRINTIALLKQVPPEYGIELDLRYEGRNLILHHDPFVTGELFEDLLKEYQHALLILNVKTEGIEEEVLRLLQKYTIKNYFFLDLSLPYLIKYMRKREQNIAIRFSEYEPIEFVMAFKDKVKWVWVDCFHDMPLNKENYSLLKKYFKICLVSPELQGYEVSRIEEFKNKLTGMEIDAVCTKRPDLW
jgi:hypothetical protein